MAYDGLGDALSLIYGAVAARSVPPPDVTVDQWAEQCRYVAAESGSSRPGRWSNRTTPYAIKPMRVSSASHPARRVAVRGSAQTLKSELVLNTILSRIDVAPRPMMLVMPSLNELQVWNRTKWRPNVRATPTVNEKVTPERSRDETSSTLQFKDFIGGYLLLATAGSSKDLQARSVCDLFLDEVSEFPTDTKNRGDPIDQARHRQDAWGDEAKELAVSTPGELPHCRISAMVEAGTLEQYYFACPHCGWYQRFLFERFDWAAATPTYACSANGCVIDETSKAAMLQYGDEGKIPGGAEWIATFVSENAENPQPPSHFAPDDLPHWLARDTEGRQPSFHIWQAYSTLKPWAKIGAEWREAQGDHAKLKVFYQQVLAEPFDGGGDAPDYEKLELRGEDRGLGGVPFGYWVLTGAADIQSNRIEWAVWAWGPRGGGFTVDRGVIPGNPMDQDDPCWAALGEIRARTYEGDNGFRFAIDMFAVDSGFASYSVYHFCNRRPATIAVDGRADRFMAPLGAPKKITAAPARPGRKPRPAALLYPVGAYGLKQKLYHGLTATLEGPDAVGVWPAGAQRFPREVGVDYLKQLTAEYLTPVQKANGAIELAWQRITGRANEALDIWVYARAAAYHAGVDRLTNEQWEALALERGGSPMKEANAPQDMWAAVGATKESQPAPQAGASDTIARRRGPMGFRRGNKDFRTL